MFNGKQKSFSAHEELKRKHATRDDFYLLVPIKIESMYNDFAGQIQAFFLHTVIINLAVQDKEVRNNFLNILSHNK
jgi:hypothetical protein